MTFTFHASKCHIEVFYVFSHKNLINKDGEPATPFVRVFGCLYDAEKYKMEVLRETPLPSPPIKRQSEAYL
jgi:hypothetical protein